jgi:hypothetical protein
MNYFLMHSYCFPWSDFLSLFFSYSDVFYLLTVGVVSNSHTHTHTHGTTPLDEISARRRDRWQHTIFTIKISMSPVGFEPSIQQASGHRRTERPPGSAWSASHALNCMYYLHFVGQSTQSALLTPIYHIATAFVCTMPDFVLLLFWYHSSALQTMISIPLALNGW